MEILFTKTGKEVHVFSCKRKDDSVTWKHVDEFFMMHDLAHFAVETILPLKTAFLGMVASGMDINEFDQPKEKRTIQPGAEAIFAEHLVNLIVIDHTQGRMDNLVEVFKSIHDEHLELGLLNLITEPKLEQIRVKYYNLKKQWNNVPVNGTMQLVFEE